MVSAATMNILPNTSHSTVCWDACDVQGVPERKVPCESQTSPARAWRQVELFVTDGSVVFENADYSCRAGLAF